MWPGLIGGLGTLFFIHFPWKTGLTHFCAHTECHQHGTKSTLLERDQIKRLFLSLCTQNYAEVDLKTSTLEIAPPKSSHASFLFPFTNTHKYQRLHPNKKMTPEALDDSVLLSLMAKPSSLNALPVPSYLADCSWFHFLAPAL